jgi:hypothetical protein
MEILEYDKDTVTPVRLNGEYIRDEAGQATYLAELLDIFETEAADSAFVFLFALDNLPHRPDGDPRHDLDLASLGIRSVIPVRAYGLGPERAPAPCHPGYGLNRSRTRK